jgi:allantoate deiminase
VPGEVRFTLDVRAPTNGQRDTVAADIMTAFARIARERGVALSREALQDLAASPCDPAWTDMLASAAQDMAVPCGRLISGAGHDAMIMAALGRTAMLFIRCEGGISHNPAEGVQADDVELARRVMISPCLNSSAKSIRPSVCSWGRVPSTLIRAYCAPCLPISWASSIRK